MKFINVKFLMRKFTHKIIILLLSGLFLFSGVRIHIYHINDFHDNLFAPVGAAKIAHFLRNSGENHLFLVAGDFISGTAYGRATNGEASMEVFYRYLNPDAIVIGNHEFDFGWQRLLELERKFPLPLISANVLKDGKRLFPESISFTIAGRVITVVGLTTTETTISTFKKYIRGLEFRDEVTVAGELVKKYRNKTDLLILLSHCGIEKDREIARKISGFDLIIGGHDHIKVNEKINSTQIVQAASYGRYMGEVIVEFNGNTKNISARLIPMKYYISKDVETEAYLKKLSSRLSSFLNRFCCTNPRAFEYNEERIRSMQDPWAHFLARALKKSLSVDAVIINAGAIRGGLPSGKIYYKHWLKVYPFQGQIMVLKIKGKYLKKALLKHSSLKVPTTAYLQMEGITISAGKEIFVNGKPLKEERLYRVLIPEFLYMGGDGYTMFKNANSFHYVNMTFPEFFFAYFSRKGRITN